jgi:NADH-quinone oxidoreductase subunit J
MLTTLSFYLFASILVFSSVMVISARNPVHSVLFLILGFFNAAGLFVLLGAEFIAFIMVIVYVGAVAVLFLFVVMMLDISFENLRKGAMQYVPLGLLLGGVLIAELIIVYTNWSVADNLSIVTPDVAAGEPSNTEALGAVLYTDYILAFQLSGLTLLVAMIGAIVLTNRNRAGVKRQAVADQFKRTPEESLEIKKVSSGQGV